MSNFLCLPPSVAQGDGDGSFLWAHHMLSLLLIALQRVDSSHSFPAPVWDPFRGRQSFMNSSKVRPFHGLLFFTNLPSMDPFHRVRNPASKPAPARISLYKISQVLLWSTPAGLPMGSHHPSGIHLLHRSQMDICSTTTSMGCWETACLTTVFTMVFTMGCRVTSTLMPGAFPTPGLGARRVFLSHILIPLSSCSYCCAGTFCPSYQRCYHCHVWSLSWPAEAPSWSQMEFAPADMEEASRSFSLEPPL